MNILKVAELTEGMRFSKPVFFDGDSLLVPADLPVKKKDLERLIRWEIEEVTTEGVLVKDTAEEKQRETYSEMLQSQADKDLLELYTSSVEKMNAVFSAVHANKLVNNEVIEKIVSSMLTALKENRDEMISFIILSGLGEQNLAASSVNTTIISIFIAQYMKLPSHRLIQLATAALLHDIGMMKVPDAVTRKNEKLSEDEFKLIRTHVIYSYRIITKTLKFAEEVGSIALQHHERWDGNGYPNKLSGDKINQASRILCVADAFEAMVSVRPYRNSMIGYKAMRELLNDNSRRFDSEILKVFIKIMGIYPIGSIVLLNDASIGRVVAVRGDAPLRPAVKLMVNKNGGKLKDNAPVIDLLNEKDLYIARAINPREVHDSQA
ncbi:MAG: HD-GYP domain-containing protein [Spirochaetales bacterium]|nr:MAG: HD-GYP domain-containing protein [Spirochaetales bacterium]